MKIAVASHIALDAIDNHQCHLGGAACYCGLICRELGLDCVLVTRVGEDFPPDKRHYLKIKGLEIKQYDKCETTRFELRQREHGYKREVKLRTKCNPLDIEDVKSVDADAWIVSPVIDEVPIGVLREIIGKKKFVMLDPQGYLRKVDPSGLVSIRRKIALDISGVSALKVDENELQVLGAVSPEILISTTTRIIRMNQYQIKLNHIDTKDTTGLGDILTAAFTCSYLKEKDPKWSICYGAGALKAALEMNSRGIKKIPTKSHIEKNASEFFKNM